MKNTKTSEILFIFLNFPKKNNLNLIFLKNFFTYAAVPHQICTGGLEWVLICLDKLNFVA